MDIFYSVDIDGWEQVADINSSFQYILLEILGKKQTAK